MHPTDRYTLALAMLEGDRSARRVLADMLEEQGERGLAQWAREGRHDKRRTLEFAVMLLPCRPAIGLAAEFIGKASNFRIGRAGKSMVATAQHWASTRTGTMESIELCRRQSYEWLRERGRAYERTAYIQAEYAEHQLAIACADALVNAMQRASESERLAANADFASAAGRDLESRQLVRQIVRQTSGLRPPMAPAISMRYESNVPWQTEQLQQLLKELLVSENDLWPR